MKYQILQGDNRETLKTLADNSIDAIVTDPPYGIDFLGKSWDANTGALETYQECLRVLKPGGHILAFSAARTYHHLAITLEQAGFEIRDQIMWIYSSGFPKSQDIGRQIQKAIYGKPDKQRFDPAVMIKIEGDNYKHPDSDKVYRKLPDINGDRLKKSHEGEGYGCVFEEVMNTTKSAGYNPSGENKPVDTGVNGFRCYTCGKDSAARYDCKNDPCELHPPLEDDKAKQWSGWGTQLKPAHEPIALARKPLKGSIKDNCLKYGVGAINIDATRVPYESVDDYDTYINNLKGPMERSTAQAGDGLGMFENQTGFKAQKGKVGKSTNPNIASDDRPSGGSNGWSRVGFSEQPVEKYSDQKKSTKPSIGTMGKAPPNLMAIGTPSTIETSDQPWIPSDLGRFPSNVLGEIPLYQKYFYCPKVSRKERHIGFDQLPDAEPLNSPDQVRNHPLWDPSIGTNAHRLKEKIRAHSNTPTVGNNHPTVKPIELMKYLIRLITPPGGTVLDPFNGSGSTGCAAVELGMTYIGCELDERYVDIATRRIEAWYEHCNPTTFNQLFERAA